MLVNYVSVIQNRESGDSCQKANSKWKVKLSVLKSSKNPIT